MDATLAGEGGDPESGGRPPVRGGKGIRHRAKGLGWIGVQAGREWPGRIPPRRLFRSPLRAGTAEGFGAPRRFGFDRKLLAHEHDALLTGLAVVARAQGEAAMRRGERWDAPEELVRVVGEVMGDPEGETAPSVHGEEKLDFPLSDSRRRAVSRDAQRHARFEPRACGRGAKARPRRRGARDPGAEHGREAEGRSRAPGERGHSRGF